MKTMKKTVVFFALLAALAVADTPSNKSNLVGTWKLLLVDNIDAEGKRSQLYGPDPQGLLIFDSAGNYSLQILREGRPKFATDDKTKGTPEEYAAAVRGSNSHFGKYTVDERAQTITFHIEHASFPNWEGTEQKRTFTLKEGRLTYVVGTPTSGGAKTTGEVAWQRVN